MPWYTGSGGEKCPGLAMDQMRIPASRRTRMVTAIWRTRCLKLELESDMQAFLDLAELRASRYSSRHCSMRAGALPFVKQTGHHYAVLISARSTSILAAITSRTST